MIARLRAFLSTSSLGVRLGSTILVALLPLGALSVIQAREAQRQIDESTLTGVGGAALQAVRDQIELIKEAQVSARVLATIIARPNLGGPSCVDQVSAMKRSIPQATVVAYAPKNGLITCSSTNKVYDFSDDPRFQKMMSTALPGLVYDAKGEISQQAIIGVRHPVFTPAGELMGFVVISLAYAEVSPSDYADSIARWRPSYIATFTGDGETLVSSDPKVDPRTALPDGWSVAQLEKMPDQAFYVTDHGERRILSVLSITRDLFLVSVWTPLDKSFALSAAAPYFLPVLTWIAALVAAAFASSRLVVRHVLALSRSMVDYVRTQRRVQIPDMSDAPIEIQHLHAAYEEMLRTIEQEEAELQNLLIDKDVLIREVNHRSGNSLQIMASIMRMYRRETTDPKLRLVLDGLINRVIALSSTHTSLYALSGQRDVAMDVILSNVVRRLKEIHGVALGVAEKRLQPIRMDAQAAIPLALALAEAVGCYFSRPGLGMDAVLVDLSEANDVIRLHVAGPAVPELLGTAQTGLVALPQRMLRQFAAQLSGTITIREEGDRASVELVFPRPKPPLYG